MKPRAEINSTIGIFIISRRAVIYNSNGVNNREFYYSIMRPAKLACQPRQLLLYIMFARPYRACVAAAILLSTHYAVAVKAVKFVSAWRILSRQSYIEQHGGRRRESPIAADIRRYAG